jgi:hypothetical protein
MNTTTDTRIGQYLSITGMVHASKSCATRGRNKGALITQDDVDYWAETGTPEHKRCERCSA